MTSFNVTIKDAAINYVLFYENSGITYRVNCDLSKVTWLPSLNSFVVLKYTSANASQPFSSSQPTPATNSNLA